MAAASENAENSKENNPVDEAKLEASVDNNKIKLEGLKVIDLKNELEKRNLDKNGVKAVLIERLKSAIEKEGGNLEDYGFTTSSDSTKLPSKKENEGENSEEYSFETSSDFNKSSSKKETESLETNGSADMNDKLSIQEKKIDLALQLSLDEEEAQLNEEESLIDIPKHSDSEITVDDSVQPENDLSTSENKATCEENKTNVTPAKVVSPDTKKKSSKSTSENTNEALSSPETKTTVKVGIGKNEKLKSANNMARCLWITGIPDVTRAADLKTLFNKQGRVIAVKIIKNAKQKPSRCYGFVTMSTSKDAAKAIRNLHHTELNGHTISVEKAKSEPGTLLKKLERSQIFFGAKKPSSIIKEIVTPKKVIVAEKELKTDCKETSKEESKTIAVKPSAEDSAKKKDEKNIATDKDKSKDKDRKSRERREREKDTRRPVKKPLPFKPRIFSYDKPRYGLGFKPSFNRRPFGNSRVGFGSSFRPRPSLVDMQKMKEDRYQRERFRERREPEHRRADENSRHRYIDRKQKEEAYRLDREKEKLRIERELLEILKLEREKYRLERERIEREREELRRQVELRRSLKRPFGRVDRESDPLWEERKKPARYEGRASFHSEPSSSSRFELPIRDRTSYVREYERQPERFSSQKQLETLHRTDFDHEDRRVFSRNDFRGRDNRRSFSSRERERHPSSRREPPRDEWKHDRRLHERVISPSNTSTQRRMTYFLRKF